MTQIKPKKIYRCPNKELGIEWNDGSTYQYPFAMLRLACPCANCIDEWTRERKINEQNIPKDLDIKDISPVGHYAIQIIWQDGHNTGIYPFALLNELKK